MTYEEKIAHIEQQIQDRHWWELAKLPENRKLFPFFVFTNFSKGKFKAGGCVQQFEPFTCEYCGEQFDTNNGGYYCAFLVWEADQDLRICCNAWHCRKGSIYEYHEQIYGFPEPLRLGKHQTSEQHQLVFRTFFSQSRKYKAMQWLKKGFTWEILKKTFEDGTVGGNDDLGCFSYHNGTLSFSKDSYSKLANNPDWILKRGDIVRIANEILAENQPNRQLELIF